VIVGAAAARGEPGKAEDYVGGDIAVHSKKLAHNGVNAR
jgi:hypothetical protein